MNHLRKRITSRLYSFIANSLIYSLITTYGLPTYGNSSLNHGIEIITPETIVPGNIDRKIHGVETPLRWQPFPNAFKYQIVIRREEPFEYETTYFTDRTYLYMKAHVNRQYQWKVRALDEQNEAITEYTEWKNFRVFSEDTAEVAPPVVSTKSKDSPNPNQLSESPNKIPISEPDIIHKYRLPDFWIWFGAGVNFISYFQSISGDSNLEFQSLKIPSYSIETGGFITKIFGLQASYKEIPGEIDNTLNNQKMINYSWQNTSIEGLYIFHEPYVEERPAKKWVAKFGLNQHKIPLLNLDQTLNQVEFKTVSFYTAHIGTSYWHLWTQKTKFEVKMQLQYPFSDTSSTVDFSVSPTFSFDGSLGATYQVYDHIHLGLWWLGQWHSFSYKSTQSNNLLSGDYNLFYSNVDIRVGIEF